ncbi:MAG: monofunctional biosynthetic peptidoglycan transglycosylase [Saprospiraceae bacterium]|nr:monofunctional biosynthetic peptidoglycan transglycosylase [Saprospiraceae bacterium]
MRYRALPWYAKILSWMGILWAVQMMYVLLLMVVFPPLTLTQLGSMGRDGRISRDYVGLEKISRSAVLAVIGAEDQLFMEHNGFDFESIEKAMDHNRKHPKRMRGASTISQQVAKNVFLWQGRSWLRKGLEVYFTAVIELLWSKRRIVEMYLNCVEMGPGIFGIQAASQKYFNRDAKKISREQAAMIAASLPNPRRYRVKPLSPYVSFRLPWVLQQMDQLEPDKNIQKLLRGLNGK